MEISWIYRLIILIVLLILSAFFSGSEVALFSLDKHKLSPKNQKLTLRIKYLINLLESPRRLLVTILVSNTIVNVAASIIAVTIALDVAEAYGFSVEISLTIQIILLTILILIFGEITPKVWATKYPFGFSNVVAIPLYWLSILIYPVSQILTELIKGLVSKIRFDKRRIVLSDDEINELADIGHERGTIEENEHEIIQSIVSFKKVIVREVMTPRVDITSISTDSTFEEILNIITSSGFSRLPLFKGDLDEIIGIVYVKDLLPFLNTKSKELSLTKIARKTMFVPETKLLNDLLQEFQEKKMHMAIVVDEFGGTAGLITLEDILEEIIGEIHDEYDKEENEITKISDEAFLVLGKLPVTDLNEILGNSFIEENTDYETVAGLILNHAGNIPKEEYSFNLNSVKFTVKEISNKRIKKVLIEKRKADE